MKPTSIAQLHRASDFLSLHVPCSPTEFRRTGLVRLFMAVAGHCHQPG